MNSVIDNIKKRRSIRKYLDKGISATTRIRAESKKTADALLLRNPELDIKPEPTKEIKKVPKF